MTQREWLEALVAFVAADGSDKEGEMLDRVIEQYGAMPIDPIPMRLTCPDCGELHIDTGEFATKIHHTHSCQRCGLTWRPAIVSTVGVRFLPGFKNAEAHHV